MSENFYNLLALLPCQYSPWKETTYSKLIDKRDKNSILYKQIINLQWSYNLINTTLKICSDCMASFMLVSSSAHCFYLSAKLVLRKFEKIIIKWIALFTFHTTDLCFFAFSRC